MAAFIGAPLTKEFNQKRFRWSFSSLNSCCPDNLSSGPQVAGHGGARWALAFLHLKKDRGVTLARPPTTFSAFCWTWKLSCRRCTSLSQASPAFSFCFFPFSSRWERTAVSAFTPVRTQKPKTLFCGSRSFKRCSLVLQWRRAKRHSKRFSFSSFSSVVFSSFSFVLHVEQMCHACDSEPNGRDLNGSSWSPDVFLWWIRGNFAWIHLDLNSVYNFKKGLQSLTGLGGITSDWLPFRCICQLGRLTDVLRLRGKFH